MRKIACTILIMIITAAGLVFLESGHAYIPISGVITSNTTWTRALSPYALTGNLIINSGVTLTIEPGVTVDFGSYQLQVSGTLIARGTSSSKIVFTSTSYSTPKVEFASTSTAWNEQTGSGCIIEHAIITSVSVVINGGSPKISNSYFTQTNDAQPITISGGSPSIENTVVIFPSTTDGIHVNYGSPSISSNYIKGQGQRYGIYTAGTAFISNNNITNCYTGIWAAGQSTIQQNNILNNVHDGIRTDNSASTIQNNAVANNLCGVSGTGIIKNNTITDNSQAGIWGPLPTATIIYNNIFGNPQNVHLTEPVDITATSNWWGTTDKTTIDGTIWDRKNDPVNLGTLIFDPFLTGSNLAAPSVPSTIPVPTPPPTPAPTSTPTSSSTPMPTSEHTEQPTPTPVPYQTENPTPTPTPASTKTPIPVESPYSPTIAQFNNSDLINVIVILCAIIATILIIMLINKKVSKKP